MTSLGMPDLLANTQFRTRASRLSRQLAQAGEELTTLRRTDISQAAGGDMRKLYLMESGAASQSAFSGAAQRAAARAEATLNAVEQVRNASESLGVDLVAAVERGDSASALRYADTARNAFGAAVRAINTRYAGRSLFAGADVGDAALADPSTILSDAFAAVAGAPDTATMRSQLRDWFMGAGSGYETDAYQGDADTTRMQVNENEYALFDVNALDPSFRQTLYGLALAIGVSEGQVPVDPGDTDQELQNAAQAMIGAQPGLVDISAHFGGIAEMATTASSDADETRVQLEMRLNDIIGIDPYEAASRLSGIEGALESALTVQSLTRNLRFVRFLQ